MGTECPECGDEIQRRGTEGQVPPACKNCMFDWAAERVDVDLDAVRASLA